MVTRYQMLDSRTTPQELKNEERKSWHTSANINTYPPPQPPPTIGTFTITTTIATSSSSSTAAPPPRHHQH